jgi:hypothetical protein
VNGPAIVSTHNDKIEYNNDDNDIIAVANMNQGGAPQLQPIIEINNTNSDANTSNNDDNSSNNEENSTGDDIINSNQGDQNDDKNNDKNDNKNKNNDTAGVHRSNG